LLIAFANGWMETATDQPSNKKRNSSNCSFSFDRRALLPFDIINIPADPGRVKVLLKKFQRLLIL
jgi:hypothetical protein